MSRTWSFYDAETGLFRPKRTVCPRSLDIRTKTPAGCVAIQGLFDHLSQRFDLATQTVVDWIPPQPDADHEWNAEEKRWVKRADVRAREQKRAAALVQIEQLERQQLRSVRELVRDPANATARLHIDEIDIAIAKLREDLV